MISTRGRYALRIMIDLAEHNREKCISLKEIAERQNLSVKYLEKIMNELLHADFVKGTRGRSGGYSLQRKPETYTVGSILKLTEKSLAPVACLGCLTNPCDYADRCRTLPMWREFNQITDDYFESVTLDKLVQV